MNAARPGDAEDAETIGYEHLRVGILVLDSAQRIVSVNRVFCELFSCGPEEVRGRPLEDLLSPRDRKGAQKFHYKLSQYDGGLVDVHLGLCIAGTEYFARLRLLRRQGDGWLVYAENTLVDQELTYQLFVAEERLRGIFKSSDDGIVVISNDLLILDRNTRFWELMRFRSAHGVLLSEDALVGKPLFKLLPPDAFPGLAEALKAPSCQELRTQAYFAERHLELKMSRVAVPLRGQVGSCLVVRDVSEQRQIERIKQEQAHFAGMAEVATEVLHNLGNMCGPLLYSSRELLTGLRGSGITRLVKANSLLSSHMHDLSAFLLDDPRGKLLPEFYLKVGEALGRERDLLIAHAEEMLAKVEQIREAISAQHGYATGSRFVEALAPDDVVREILHLQKDTLDRHGIRVVREGEIRQAVRAQRAKLAHALLNLFKNAVEAMSGTERDSRLLTITLGINDQRRPFIRITDSGQGISMEELPRLFSPGFTTKTTGRGFGLHFCATAMHEMQGTISVESQGPGRGASFTLLFADEPI
jgi:signal transduction histidine kinase